MKLKLDKGLRIQRNVILKNTLEFKLGKFIISEKNPNAYVRYFMGPTIAYIFGGLISSGGINGARIDFKMAQN